MAKGKGFSAIAKLQKLWNPFRDWNESPALGWDTGRGFKNSETLLGIETQGEPKSTTTVVRFKNSETLLGIETLTDTHSVAQVTWLQKLWNPFRDWNKIKCF